MAADSECWPGAGANKNNCLLKDNVKLLTISPAGCLKNDILENMNESFFLGSKRSDLCHCFGSNSVVSLGVHALDMHCDEKSAENVKFSQICEENEENCRKKRCTDRYDSSESSDSGVAALSSSSTSDITDPGSPFSTASTHSSNSESGDEKPPTYQSAFPSGSNVDGTAELPATDFVHLLQTNDTPCFVGKRRSPKPDDEDGRNFISLRDTDTLLRIAQPSVAASTTRSATWNAGAPKVARISVGNDDGIEGDSSPNEVPHVPRNEVPTSAPTRRNSVTQSLCSLSCDSNNMGPSVGCGGASGAVLSVDLLHRSSDGEVSKPTPSAGNKSKTCSTSSRSPPLRTVDSKTCAISESSVEASSPVWTRMEENSNLVQLKCRVPTSATIALTVPTYCILSSKLARLRGGKVTKTLPGECFRSPTPKSFRWPQTSKSPSMASYLGVASEVVSSPISPPLQSPVPLEEAGWGNARTKTKRYTAVKPIPSANEPNERLKYHLTQTKLVQESKASDVDRNVHVTRQQVLARRSDLPLLPGLLTPQTKAPHQGKITEYFKTQRKPVGHVKKDLPKDVAGLNCKTEKSMSTDIPGDEETKLDEYFSLLTGPTKMTKNVHTAANKNVSITSPVQVFLLNKVEPDSRVAILNNYKPQPCLAASPKKTPSTTQKVAERNNGLHPPAKPIFLMPDTQKLQKKSSSPKKGTLAAKSGHQCKLTQSNSNNNLCSATADVPMLNAFNTRSNGTDDRTNCCVSSAEMDSSDCNLEKRLEIVMECSNLLVHESNSVDSESGASSNLSVAVSTSSAASFPTISPILSAPKTIRFPATQRKSLLGSQHDNDDKTQCRWADCSESFHSSSGLMEHLQTKHVLPQTSGEHYVCLWVGCKVFSRKSCSQSWLERHASSHGGNKPFRCIVDGCGQRFGSNTALERHVNGHFDQEGGASNGQGPRRSLDGVSGKMMRRNGKKLRYRKQPWSARMFDYFDSGIMEGLQHRLVGMTQARTSGYESTPGNTMVLTSKVMARRIAPDGTTRFLLKWFPADVLDDEWVAQSQVVSTRSVPIPQLPAAAAAPLHSALLAARDPPRNKRRRKPICPRKT